MSARTQNINTIEEGVRTNTSVARCTLSIAILSLVLSWIFPDFLKVSIASFVIFVTWLVGRCTHNIRYWHTRPQPTAETLAEWPKPAERKRAFPKSEMEDDKFFDDYTDYLLGNISGYGHRKN